MESGTSNAADRPIGSPALPSLDDQIKAAQRDKLQAEVKHLNGISMETLGKLGVTVFGILAAVFALVTGVPQTRLELAKAQEELVLKKEELVKRTADVASQAALADKKASEVHQKAAELADTESRRARSADELARLQTEVKALGIELERRRLAAGNPLDREVEQRISQASKPRVFVQFAGDVSRDGVIDPLRKALAGQGLVVPAAERINKGQNNEVRYFSQDEDQRSLAQRVAEVTQAYFTGLGCPLPALSIRYVNLIQGQQSPVELWLMHNCPGR